jgi:hypothetical protein
MGAAHGSRRSSRSTDNDSRYKEYDPSKSADDEKRFRDMTGGFELLKILKSEPLHVEFLVKEKRGDTQTIGKIDVKEGERALVVKSLLRLSVD